MKKQIIIHTDELTHAWLSDEAKASRRTLGNQVLYLLLGIKDVAKKPKLQTKQNNAVA
jgi:hypothetical protein